MRPEALKDMMQLDVPNLWAKSKYREFHTGHLHSRELKNNKIVIQKGKLQEELAGVVVRRIGSISVTDKWHYEQGYIGAIAQGVSFIVNKSRHIIAEFPISF